VPGLLDGVFGTKSWMTHIGQKGGSAVSEAKLTAARINGAKGGRPRSPALDTRLRDADGQIRAKNRDTLVGTLRQTYGDDFAKGFRSNMRLDTLIHRTGVETLRELLEHRQKEKKTRRH